MSVNYKENFNGDSIKVKYCNTALLLHRTSCPEVEIRILYVYTDTTVPFHVFKSYKCIHQEPLKFSNFDHY